jgi:hypothetical protein
MHSQACQQAQSDLRQSEVKLHAIVAAMALNHRPGFLAFFVRNSTVTALECLLSYGIIALKPHKNHVSVPCESSVTHPLNHRLIPSQIPHKTKTPFSLPIQSWFSQDFRPGVAVWKLLVLSLDLPSSCFFAFFLSGFRPCSLGESRFIPPK